MRSARVIPAAPLERRDRTPVPIHAGAPAAGYTRRTPPHWSGWAAAGPCPEELTSAMIDISWRSGAPSTGGASLGVAQGPPGKPAIEGDCPVDRELLLGAANC
ncbi:hypothetical protein [Streptomyces longisporus]|uniref:Uncharacterized protein n=1 Tax=Streptomyces longisporus TaxID=1948 RepID=A0ABP5Z348_STRLO